jgi:hypothetical protein
MLDHPLSRGTEAMIGESGSAHHQLGNPAAVLAQGGCCTFQGRWCCTTSSNIR